MIDNLQQWLQWLIGILIGSVAGYIASWIVARASHRLVYQCSSQAVIDLDKHVVPERMRILVDNAEVERLVVTRLVLWNRGSRSLRASDVAQPIRVCLDENARIFECSILRRSRNDNALSIDQGDRSIEISFTHLDRNDGVYLRILHDSDDSQPKLEGTIVGSRIPFRNLGEVTYRNTGSFWSRVLRWVAILLPGAYAGSGVLLYIFPPEWGPVDGAMIMIGVGGTLFAIGASKAWEDKRRCPRSLDITRPSESTS